MKNNFIGVALVAFLLTLASCEKQNTVETIAVKQMLLRSDEYYANLRAYKKSKHQVFFGWFGGTGAAGNSEISGVYDHIPDSVDIVSLWGSYPPPGSYNASKLQNLREQKGVKFVWCLFGSGVTNLMNKNFPKIALPASIDSVAKSIADTLNKHKLDGFDLDYEPSYGDGGIFGHGTKDAGGDIYTQYLFKALSKYMGPLSGTGRLLIIDGENEKGIAGYIDYLVQQAYKSSSPAALQSRYLTYGFSGTLPPGKFIPAEDFETGWSTGGVSFTDPVLGTIPSLIGFARWQPTQGQKGGIGAYHAEYEYSSTPDFKYIRQAIQTMNPAVK